MGEQGTAKRQNGQSGMGFRKGHRLLRFGTTRNQKRRRREIPFEQERFAEEAVSVPVRSPGEFFERREAAREKTDWPLRFARLFKKEKVAEPRLGDESEHLFAVGHPEIAGEPEDFLRPVVEIVSETAALGLELRRRNQSSIPANGKIPFLLRAVIPGNGKSSPEENFVIAVASGLRKLFEKNAERIQLFPARHFPARTGILSTTAFLAFGLAKSRIPIEFHGMLEFVVELLFGEREADIWNFAHALDITRSGHPRQGDRFRSSK